MIQEKKRIEDIISEEGIYVSTVSGYSMSPMLKDRQDTVAVAAFKGDLKKYDVALYRVGDKYILHRVVKVLEDEYIICGDNCVALERVPKCAVIGKLCEAWSGEKKIDLDSPKYLSYCRRRVSGIYPRKVLRAMKGFVASVLGKTSKK